MEYFNYIGLIFMAVIMVPNIIMSIKNKEDFVNLYKSKFVEIFEQIGRYGCFVLMIVNIPYTFFPFWFINAKLVYIIVGVILCLLYIISFILFSHNHPLLKAYFLSLIPSILFIFSGIVLGNIPLIAFSLIFAYFHINLSLKNAYLKIKKPI